MTAVRRRTKAQREVKPCGDCQVNMTASITYLHGTISKPQCTGAAKDPRSSSAREWIKQHFVLMQPFLKNANSEKKIWKH